jgi:hypothetical protein
MSWIWESSRPPVPIPFPYEEGLLALGLVLHTLFLWVLQFYLFIMLEYLRRVLGVVVVSHGMLTRPWMP